MNVYKEGKTHPSLQQRIWALWAKWETREKRMMPFNQQFLGSATKGHASSFRNNKSGLRFSKVMCSNTDIMLNWFNWAVLSPASMTSQGCRRTSWVTLLWILLHVGRWNVHIPGVNTPPWFRGSVPLTSYTPLLPFPATMGKRFCQRPFLDPHLTFPSSSLIIHSQPFEEKDKWMAQLLATCTLTGLEDITGLFFVFWFFFSEGCSCGGILKPVSHDLSDTDHHLGPLIHCL